MKSPGFCRRILCNNKTPKKKECCMVFGFIVGQFHAVLLNNPFSSAHYLPAIRGGIMQSHRGLGGCNNGAGALCGIAGAFASDKHRADV